MQRAARLLISRRPPSHLRPLNVRSYAATRRPRRVEPRAQDLSARFQQLERTLRTKEALTDQLADSDHVRSSTVLDLAQDSQLRRVVKPTRTFHGLIIPDKPSEPEADECCMSGCAVCVYDLYDESVQSYKESLQSIRASLAEMNVPEGDWPTDIRTVSGPSEPPREKSATLSAFEEMERQLAEKRAQKATNAASEADEGVDLSQIEREKALARRAELERVKQMRDKKARVTLKDIYEALQWITFSNR